MGIRVKNQRAIALLSILAGLLYFASLLYAIIDGHQAGIENVSPYWENKLFKDKKESSGFSPEYKKISLEGNRDFYFQDSVVNLKDNSVIPLNHSAIDVIAIEPQPKTTLSLFVFLAEIIVMIFLIPAFLTVPVVFYKLIFSIYKGNIFTSDNVYRLNILGYIVLITYAIALAWGQLLYMEKKSIVELENYHIPAPDIWGSVSFVMFGVIILLIAQVMKKALLMKEEQDLTI